MISSVTKYHFETLILNDHIKTIELSIETVYSTHLDSYGILSGMLYVLKSEICRCMCTNICLHVHIHLFPSFLVLLAESV